MLLAYKNFTAKNLSFQSSSAPKDGCYGTASVTMGGQTTFQSSSAPKDGCYSPSQAGVYGNNNVFQSSSAPKDGCYVNDKLQCRSHVLFQSSSAPKDGCYSDWLEQLETENVFQSSSAPKDGCYVWAAWSRLWQTGFNPHPPRRTDATSSEKIRL